MRVILASILNNIGGIDYEFNTLNKADLIIGVEDKKIAVMTETGIEEIVSKSELSKLSPINGYVKIPINIGNTPFGYLTIQWGRVELQPQTDTTFDYYIPFTDACYNLQASAAYNGDISIIKIDKVSNSQFKMKSTDGTSAGRVYWLAIGV